MTIEYRSVEFDTIETMVRNHGLRGVLNAVAMVCICFGNDARDNEQRPVNGSDNGEPWTRAAWAIEDATRELPIQS